MEIKVQFGDSTLLTILLSHTFVFHNSPANELSSVGVCKTISSPALPATHSWACRSSPLCKLVRCTVVPLASLSPLCLTTPCARLAVPLCASSLTNPNPLFQCPFAGTLTPCPSTLTLISRYSFHLLQVLGPLITAAQPLP